MSREKNLAAKKNNPAKNPKIPPLRTGLKSEIIAIILIFFAIFLMVSLLDFGGALGRLVSVLFLGLMGAVAFVLPFALVFYAVLLLLKRTELLAASKVIMFAVLLVVIMGLAHLMGFVPLELDGLEETPTFWQHARHAFESGAWRNGGLIGAGLGSLFVSITNEFLTYILFIALCAILFILITGQSIFAAIQSGAKSARNAGARIARPPHRHPDDDSGNHDNSNYITLPKKVYDKRIENINAEPTDNPADTHSPISIAKGISRTTATALSTKLPKDIILEDEDKYSDKYTDKYIPLKKRIAPEIMDFQQFLDSPDSNDAHVGTRVTNPPIDEETPIQEQELPFGIKGMVEGVTSDSHNEYEDTDEPPWDLDTSNNTAGTVIHDRPQFPSSEETNTPVLDADGAVNAASPAYIFPPVELLRENTYQPSLSSRAQILENSKKLEETLQSFGVSARVVEVSRGPTVTRYELSPGSGVKVSKISGLADDLALNLAAESIRVEAPIPGKSVVGIEIPNKEVQAVYLREVIDDEAFWSHPSKITFAMGKDIAGNIVVADIARMPHLLIAGSTGSGKSVCINTIIVSIIYKANPTEVKLLMIDPKVVELSIYNGIPHLIIPVVTDPKKASGALAWAVREMDSRYNLFAEAGVRDLTGYNNQLSEKGEEKLPQIVILIDELADLMMSCGKEVEESICRLAQKARAAGIHLIVATQRPSVDVITGLIKANVPGRLAFAVASGTDSRTILDETGAEKLLGKGDMLFSPAGRNKPRRIQGSNITEKEIERIVNFIKQDGPTNYSEEMIEKITTITSAPDDDFDDSDPLIEDAIAFIVEREKASTSMLQRKFRIGYNRAARMMEELVARGLVGPEDGAKPRKVLMTHYQHREYVQRRQETIDSQIRSGDY
jgi:S-DNA-T family DNA segregation ATPase FtsK/SpoIIIE